MCMVHVCVCVCGECFNSFGGRMPSCAKVFMFIAAATKSNNGLKCNAKRIRVNVSIWIFSKFYCSAPFSNRITRMHIVRLNGLSVSLTLQLSIWSNKLRSNRTHNGRAHLVEKSKRPHGEHGRMHNCTTETKLSGSLCFWLGNVNSF